MLNLNLLCPKIDPAPRPGTVVVHRATGQRAVLLQQAYRPYYLVDDGVTPEHELRLWRGISIAPAELPPTLGLGGGLARYYRWPPDFECWPGNFYERQRWASSLDEMDRMAESDLAGARCLPKLS